MNPKVPGFDPQPNGSWLTVIAIPDVYIGTIVTLWKQRVLLDGELILQPYLVAFVTLRFGQEIHGIENPNSCNQYWVWNTACAEELEHIGRTSLNHPNIIEISEILQFGA